MVKRKQLAEPLRRRARDVIDPILYHTQKGPDLSYDVKFNFDSAMELFYRTSASRANSDSYPCITLKQGLRNG